MKGLAAVIVIFMVILFFLYTQKSQYVVLPSVGKRSDFSAVDPTIIQNAITQIQENAETLYPINTIYFNREGSGYSGRIMFMDSSNYAGVQYDITADENGTLTSASKGVPASFQNPFTGFVKKFRIGNLDTTPPTPDMQAIWNNFMVTA